MSEILNLYPARVTGPAGEWGDTHNRARAFVYTRPTGDTRLVVLDAQGHTLAKTTVAAYRYNGDGMEVDDPHGNVWYVVAIAGCSTCGGGTSLARTHEMLRGQGEDE